MSLVKWAVGLGVVGLAAKVGYDVRKSIKKDKGPQPLVVLGRSLGSVETTETSVTFNPGAKVIKVEVADVPAPAAGPVSSS